MTPKTVWFHSDCGPLEATIEAAPTRSGRARLRIALGEPVANSACFSDSEVAAGVAFRDCDQFDPDANDSAFGMFTASKTPPKPSKPSKPSKKKPADDPTESGAD